MQVGVPAGFLQEKLRQYRDQELALEAASVQGPGLPNNKQSQPAEARAQHPDVTDLVIEQLEASLRNRDKDL